MFYMRPCKCPDTWVPCCHTPGEKWVGSYEMQHCILKQTSVGCKGLKLCHLRFREFAFVGIWSESWGRAAFVCTAYTHTHTHIHQMCNPYTFFHWTQLWRRNCCWPKRISPSRVQKRENTVETPNELAELRRCLISCGGKSGFRNGKVTTYRKCKYLQKIDSEATCQFCKYACITLWLR